MRKYIPCYISWYIAWYIPYGIYHMVYTIWYIPWYISHYISLLYDIYHGIYHGIYHMVYTIWYIPIAAWYIPSKSGIYHGATFQMAISHARRRHGVRVRIVTDATVQWRKSGRLGCEGGGWRWRFSACMKRSGECVRKMWILKRQC